MNENNTMRFGAEDAPILPDGWDGVSDIFTEEGALRPSAFGESDSGEAHTTPLQAEPSAQAADGQAGEKAPAVTDGEADTMADPVQGAQSEEAEETDTGEKISGGRVLTLKVDHSAEALDVDAMSDEELTALLQKGRAYDRLRSAVDRQRADAQRQSAPPRDFLAEVEELKALYPDFTEMPEEVARTVAGGAPLTETYRAWRERRRDRDTLALRRENAVLRQNADAAARAVVRGVSGGGSVTPPRVDDFLKGFEAEW